MKHSARLVLGALTVLVTVAAVSSPAQTPPPRPAVPLEPVAAIVDAFRSHSVVAVTAGHGQERGYAFLLSLVRDLRFVAVVNDIVIEEGSARYQNVADRFIGGDDVSDESLSQIWQNTTQATPGLDRPWSEFFRAVRSLNAFRCSVLAGAKHRRCSWNGARRGRLYVLLSLRGDGPFRSPRWQSRFLRSHPARSVANSARGRSVRCRAVSGAAPVRERSRLARPLC
jgi:hypothetical protein